MAEFFPVFLYFGLVLGITCCMLFLTTLFRSQHSTEAKGRPYESGIITSTQLFRKNIPIRHCATALLFLLFDIEALFLYPWAVVGKNLGLFAFYEIVLFLVLATVGFIYAWKKGGFEWE